MRGGPQALRARLEAAFCPIDWVTDCTCAECVELARFMRANPFWKAWTPADCFRMNTAALMGRAFDYFLPAYIWAMEIDAHAADVAVDFSAYLFILTAENECPKRAADIKALERLATYGWA